MDLNDWLTIAVPIIISIIGFVVTFVSLSKSLKKMYGNLPVTNT